MDSSDVTKVYGFHTESTESTELYEFSLKIKIKTKNNQLKLITSSMLQKLNKKKSNNEPNL